jgi:non-heme chloroperoxidase
VLDVLDLREVTLVGHSFGCVEAVRYAAREGRGRVTRLALLSTTTPFLRKTGDNPGGIDDVAFEFLRTVWRQDFSRWLEENTAAFFTPETSELTIRWIGNMMMHTPLDVGIACNETMVAADVRADLRSVSIPALVVHGDADASAPLALTGAPTAALVPQAVFKVYEGAPHGIFVTHKEKLNADLAAFLA